MVFLGVNESTLWFMLFQSVSLVNVIPSLRTRSYAEKINMNLTVCKMGGHAMGKVLSKINAVLSVNLTGDQANIFQGITPFTAVYHVP